MKTKRFLGLCITAVLLLTAVIALTAAAQEPGSDLRAVQALDEFMIVELTADDAHVVDHDGLTGDDRGGIATSGSRVLVTGDDATGSFALADLGGGFSVGEVYDMLVSDLKTGQIYLLGHEDVPVPSSAGEQTVSQLLLVDGESGALTGQAVTLTPSFSLNTGYGTGALFAGYGRVVVYDGVNSATWSIETPSGVVSSLPFSELPYYYGCENWAMWGIAEYFGGEDYLVYRGDGHEIWRTRVSDGDTTTLASFSDLSDMCSLTAGIGYSRWYFHYESSGQFGGVDETLGYARATFQFPAGHLEGYVRDELTTAPIEGATVSTGWFQAETGADGYYTMLLPAGTYTVTASLPAYTAESVTDVDVTTGAVTAQNFQLMPRVTFDPSPVHVTLDWQTTGTADATIHNYMATPYEFEFAERGGGFVPLAQLSTGGWQIMAPTSAIALVSDDFELAAITGILDDMGLAYDVWNDESTSLYLADPTFLDAYGVIVWYTHDRQITQGEHDALEAWLQAGGRLLVTGYDSLGSDDDPLLADLVRSSTYGDDARGDTYEILLDHPITNGPYGVYAPGTQLSINETDQDNAVADTARGAQAVATIVDEPYDKILATDLGSGIVVYWNGNYECDDWLATTVTADTALEDKALKDKVREDKGELLAKPASITSQDGQNLFRNALAWLTVPSDVPWLGQDPITGTVPAGGSADVTLLFDATYDAGINQPGDYDATLVMKGDPTLDVPVLMTVLPPANLGRVGGYVLDRCTGDGAEATITIAGGVPITQTASDPDTGRYAAWLVPGSYEFEFSAPGYFTHTATVDVTAGQTTTLDVVFFPDRPCMAVQPDQLEVWLLEGTDVYAHPTGLGITNDGAQPLDFGVYELDGTVGTHPGGPDPFGYTYVDSNQPGGPTYDWVEIATPAGGSGTAITFSGTDDSYFWPLDLPRPFNFYGSDYSQMAVATNGTLYFEDAYLGYSNWTLPSDGGDGVWTFIAHMWDDLYVSPGAVYYQDLGDRFVIEYYQVDGCCDGSDHGTWEIILYDNGSILFQYQDVDFAGTGYDNGSSATVGIQGHDADPDYYLEYSSNAPVLEPGLAVCFAYPGSAGCDLAEEVPWIWTEPVSGTVPPDLRATANVQVMFTALYTDLMPMPLGTYSATLMVTGNDPVSGRQSVPAFMHIVDEMAMPALSDDSYGCGLAGDTVTHSFTVTNSGPTTGSFDISVDYGTWTATPSLTSIGPLAAGASQSFEVVVDIPSGAMVGATDTFTVTAEYPSIPGFYDVAYGETCVEEPPYHYIYLPILVRNWP
ncbi:MAG: carboxypeptidase regulatory-like domain-containing protein [Anaerolineae bacterium]|nr:carboxypeptidase regulatory-like domain-containing protein [Anaerolineae bacterium]